MATLKWTREAEAWLKDIYDYIAKDSPVAAARVVDGIYNRAQDLIRFPQIGHRYQPIANREIRILLYGHYRIAYLVRTDKDIDVLGVFHGALDIEKYLI